MRRVALVLALAFLGCETAVLVGYPSDGGSGGTGGGGATGGGGGAGGGATGGGDGSTDAGGDDGGADAGPPGGDTCQAAVRVAQNSSTTFTLSGYANDYVSSSGCPGGAGPDRVFVVDVPPLQRLTATVSVPAAGSFGIRTSLGLLPWAPSICVPALGGCVASSTASLPAYSAVWTNPRSTTQDVLMVIDHFDADVPPSVTLTTSVGQPAPGDLCGAPVPLSPGVPTQGSLASMANDSPNTCVFGDGADAYWSITLPQSAWLVATVKPSAQLDATLALAWDSCPVSSCIDDVSEAGQGGTEQLTLKNTTGAALPILIAVKSYWPAPGSQTYEVTGTVAYPLAGDTCLLAIWLPSSIVLPNESFVDYFDDYLTRGRDRVYKVAVPAGHRLVTVASGRLPDGGTTPGPRVLLYRELSGCAAQPPVASSDRGAAAYRNTSAAPETIYLLIDDLDVTTLGVDGFRFSLSVEVAPPATADAGSRHVFATSSTFPGDLGGLTGADSRCAAAAAGAGLTGSWKAWVADSSASPASRFAQAAVPYRLLNGVAIADDWADLTDGTLAAPIDRTELGISTGVYGSAGIVWTGVGPDGGQAGSSCVNWTNGAGFYTGGTGRIDRADAGWTESGSVYCDVAGGARLFCFQQ